MPHSEVAKKNTIVILLFHRDLSIADHQGIIETRREHPGSHIMPIFIFTPSQVTNNPYKSPNSVRFMIESLEDLEEETEGYLTLYYGDTLLILKRLFQELGDKLAGLVETKDYTPFAVKRQQEVRGLCALSGIKYHLVEQTYLTTPGTVLNAQGRAFQKFTPFWEHARQRPVEKPAGIKGRQVKWMRAGEQKNAIGITEFAINFAEARRKFLGPEDRLSPSASVRHGGRKAALKLLANLPKNYDETHDCLAIETSRLSAHNHFGTVSIREVYWAARDAMPEKHLAGFIRQLYWRDFYGHICWAFEGLYGVSPYDFWTERDPEQKRHQIATAPSYESPRAHKAFEAWTRGETGAELVDAGMRQLMAEGFIHNRARLVVADYLVKEMRVPWRWGERWFAQHLVDYDFAQNFGNWCWVASVLPFSQAPFRRHKPDTIQARLDPQLEYTEKWLKRRHLEQQASK